MQAYYHSSDNLPTTNVTAITDLLHDMKETIGNRLRRVRKDARLTQEKLAEKANCSTSLIGNIETGIRGYGESVVSIARALDVTPEYLQLLTDNLDAAAPVPGYSVEALALAWLLDQVKDKLQKKKAETEASAVILRYVNEQPGAGPTHTPGGH